MTAEFLPGSIPGPIPGPTLGVAICALNERAALPRLLTRLTSIRDAADCADLVVVADGGSTDGTPEIAAAGGARVLKVGRGRGVQLRAAAEVLLEADLDVLLFLHADSVPRLGSVAAVRAAFASTEDSPVRATAMRQVIEAEGRMFRWIERAANARSRRGMVYGDSGLALRADLYRESGGFAEIPLFEDVDLSRRIRRVSGIHLVETATLVISARRWREEGLLRSSVRNWILRGMYECGVSPERLVRLYRPFSGRSGSPAAAKGRGDHVENDLQPPTAP
ncbi:Glycosyl transferase family 2 [Planctomycetes bacterium Poly30]|uniref:Glycosyl transferase family 2 n=1 Tax=Saltatorellus ferox TaxID=2528018 RepID=A0A518EU33_9BACT|nr:Glycosyl transferase family 2 [Planctomycetes bacterium Poly30]